MTVQIRNFHDWLRYALPASASEIMEDLQDGHNAKLADYAEFPKDAAQLSAALIALEKAGMARREGGAWRWQDGKPVTEQRALFA